MMPNLRHLIYLYRYFRDNPYFDYAAHLREHLVWWRDSGKVTAKAKTIIEGVLDDAEH